jgi:hypothetical protein
VEKRIEFREPSGSRRSFLHAGSRLLSNDFPRETHALPRLRMDKILGHFFHVCDSIGHLRKALLVFSTAGLYQMWTHKSRFRDNRGSHTFHYLPTQFQGSCEHYPDGYSTSRFTVDFLEKRSRRINPAGIQRHFLHEKVLWVIQYDRVRGSQYRPHPGGTGSSRFFTVFPKEAGSNSSAVPRFVFCSLTHTVPLLCSS